MKKQRKQEWRAEKTGRTQSWAFVSQLVEKESRGVSWSNMYVFLQVLFLVFCRHVWHFLPTFIMSQKISQWYLSFSPPVNESLSVSVNRRLSGCVILQTAEVVNLIQPQLFKKLQLPQGWNRLAELRSTFLIKKNDTLLSNFCAYGASMCVQMEICNHYCEWCNMWGSRLNRTLSTDFSLLRSFFIGPVMSFVSSHILFCSPGCHGINLSVSLPCSTRCGLLCGWPGTSSSSASTWT